MSTEAPEELELNMERYCSGAELDDLGDAIDNASDRDRITWLVSEGRRIAAIVPVEVAEHYTRMLSGVTERPAGKHHLGAPVRTEASQS